MKNQTVMSYGENQKNRLRNALKTGAIITRLNAYTELGIFELSARILEIERLGFPISRKRVTVFNRFGEKISVVQYTQAIKTK